MHYGVSLDLLKPELLSAQKKAWKSLGSLIDTWEFLANQQQSFLVEAVERIHVNQSLSEMSISLLDTALAMTRNKGDPNAVHALLLVNTKLLALYSRYKLTPTHTKKMSAVPSANLAPCCGGIVCMREGGV